MDSYVIETSKVSRSFGNSIAVRELDLRVERGSIYGLLGRNGAGKTTVACSGPTPGKSALMGLTRRDLPPETAGK